jgi:hypothetical protein
MYEHWPSERIAYRAGLKWKAKAGAKLAAQFPDARPWSVKFTSKGPVIADVVSLWEFKDALSHLEAELLAFERKSI